MLTRSVYLSRWTFPLVMSLDGSHVAIVKRLAIANHAHTWWRTMSPVTLKGYYLRRGTSFKNHCSIGWVRWTPSLTDLGHLPAVEPRRLNRRPAGIPAQDATILINKQKIRSLHAASVRILRSAESISTKNKRQLLAVTCFGKCDICIMTVENNNCQNVTESRIHADSLTVFLQDGGGGLPPLHVVSLLEFSSPEPRA